MKKDLIEEFDIELRKNGINRREALKLMGISGSLLLMNNKAYSTNLNASDVKAKIVIVGGGLAGISTAARLSNSLTNPDITIIEPNAKSVSYQAGNTLVGAGIYDKNDVIYETKEFLPKTVKLIKDKAVQFDPKNNKLRVQKGDTIEYDFLVIAAGLVLDFEKIEGLEELEYLYTVQDSQKMNKFFKNTNASTIYNVDGAVQTWENMKKTIYAANNGKKQQAIFSHPNTPIKCGGAPKKIMYLMNSRLNEVSAKARQNVNMHFYTNSSKMFSVKEYEDAIIQQFKVRDMKYSLNHNLTKVDLKNKTATFDKFWNEKGSWDPDLEEYNRIIKHINLEIPYDFLHITPPMKAAPEIADSEIGSSKGWVPVNKETLQHVKYDNIFSLGDIAAIPLGKTGGSIRKQYKVVVDNILSLMEGKELKAKYDGYTVCPIITDIGKVMLAEFDWSMKPKPSFPLDPTQERYIWWLLKSYILKPMTQYGMLSGKI